MNRIPGIGKKKSITKLLKLVNFMCMCILFQEKKIK